MKPGAAVGNEAPDALVDLRKLTQQRAAALIGVTARSLRDWSEAPRNDDGTYSGDELVAWRIAQFASPEGSLDLDREKARHAKEQADRLALENAARRGELAEMSEVHKVWSAALSAFRSRMLATPSKLAPSVNPGDPNRARDVIERELTAILAELAALDVGAVETERAAEPSGPAADPAPAPEADSKPVGRPRAKAQRRKQRGAGKVADQ